MHGSHVLQALEKRGLLPKGETLSETPFCPADPGRPSSAPTSSGSCWSSPNSHGAWPATGPASLCHWWPGTQGQAAQAGGSPHPAFQDLQLRPYTLCTDPSVLH